MSKKAITIGLGTLMLALGYMIFSMPFLHWAFFDDVGWIVIPLLQVVLVVVYLIDVFRRDWDLGWKKPLWVIALLAFAVIAMPVYWVAFFRKEQV